jgi:hypothetical protein
MREKRLSGSEGGGARAQARALPTPIFARAPKGSIGFQPVFAGAAAHSTGRMPMLLCAPSQR